MTDISLSNPNSDDIFALGFDKTLNRASDTPIDSPTVYDISDSVPTQALSVGTLVTGAGSSLIVLDPSKGLWIGATTYPNAPFRVNMGGDMAANSGSIGGFVIGSNYIKDSGDTFGFTTAGASTSFDTRIWAGDTFANRLSAPFQVRGATGEIILSGAAGAARLIAGRTNSSERWQLILRNGTAEAGSNAGSDFQISNFTDNGTSLGTPLFIERKTGNTVFTTTGATPALPNAASLVELQSTTQGFRLPNMTGTQRDAITTPPKGLMIFNTTTNKINVFTTVWEAVTSA